MRAKSEKLRIYAFIDSQNLNLGILDQGWKLDFGRFRIYLKDKYGAEKAFLFIGYKSGNEALYTYLQRAGYIVVLKPTLEIKKENKIIIKGNVDAELVLHTMIEYPNYDKAIIVSGNGDFRCLVEYLAQKSKLFHLIIPNPKKFSALLREFRSYFAYITGNLRNKLEDKKREGVSFGRTLGVPPHRDS
jgi:uncharacterized LabA/DUF88 family protein